MRTRQKPKVIDRHTSPWNNPFHTHIVERRKEQTKLLRIYRKRNIVATQIHPNTGFSVFDTRKCLFNSNLGMRAYSVIFKSLRKRAR